MKSLDGHLSEIYSGGWPVIQWKILAFYNIYLSLLINAIWAIPAVLLLRCLRHWRIIRFGKIISSRIGPFTNDGAYLWVMSQQQSKMYLDLYWFDQPICNDFWAMMVLQNFHVYSWVRFLDRWNQILPGGVMHHYPFNTCISAFLNIHGWPEETQAKLPFHSEDDARAKDWLRQQGWHDEELFVCLLVRDSAYLDSTNYLNITPPPLSDGGIQYQSKHGYGWKHEDYRDSDIATYVPAAEWLANQGVWVLRMGKVVEKPIPCSHPRVIDYAFHPDRSDFMDVWLFAHCDLCISTGTGPDNISDIYSRPILFLNFIPLQRLTRWSDAMHVPKTLVWQTSGIPLNCREYLNNNYSFTYQYDNNGIKIIDLTSEEILATVQERWQRLQGTWVDTEDDLKRYHKFLEIFKSDPEFQKCHVWIHPQCRVGATWLRSMGDVFLD